MLMAIINIINIIIININIIKASVGLAAERTRLEAIGDNVKWVAKDKFT